MGQQTWLGGFDLDGFLNTGGIERDASLVAVRFDHQEERVSEVFATFVQRPSVGHGPGDFLNPPNVQAGGFGLDDGVECLAHGLMKAMRGGLVKENLPD